MVDNNFAVLIQKRWRGYKTRSKVYAEISEDPTKTPETSMMRKRLMPPPRTPLRGNSEGISNKQEVAEILPTEGTRTNTEKIPFDQNYDVVILIDGLAGLPLITTATRIQTTLYMPTKQQVTDSYFSSISDLQSEFTNPHYSIRIRWRGTASNYFT